MSEDKSINNAVVLSINQRRWRKFKTLKRGYYSLIILMSLYFLSFFLPILVNNKALVVKYNNSYYFPAFRDLLDIPLIGAVGGSSFTSGETLGQIGNASECRYRELQQQFKNSNSDNFVLMPLYPYNPFEGTDVKDGEKFMPPLSSINGSSIRLLGTDNNARDVFSRMAYGFQVSISFALFVAILEYLIGVPLGAAMGYFGGKFDLTMQRFIEIWHSLPFLFLVMILVSIFDSTFFLLVAVLTLFAWLGPAAQMRAQFLREKSRDYVAAAISIGVPTWQILIKHILPNSLVPIITFFPFAVVGGISALVSLDFLGFGLPAPTPSWGQMVSVGLEHVTDGYWWLVLVPLSAMFFTLILVTFIGEGIREAFDPKVFSRLR
ncbi:MAG: ABC transporter permease subunit [Candidatus Kapaibacterium sp.]|nr:ABC transporter permease subunit [Bacteroidota bacterium]